MYAILNNDNVCVMMSVTKDGYGNYVETNVDRLGKKYENGKWIEVPIPEPQLTETEQAILDTAINVDYLVCMKELEI
jgi:hypothetical protein